MGLFAVGDVVLVPFPYADFSRIKRRPSLVISKAEFDNLILCQITSQAQTSQKAIKLDRDDFASGSLRISSFIRPDKLFTVEQSVIEKNIGSLTDIKLKSVKAAVRQLFV